MDTVNITNWFDVLVWVVVLYILFGIIGYLLNLSTAKTHH